jgi:hypothetical protein
MWWLRWATATEHIALLTDGAQVALCVLTNYPNWSARSNVAASLDAVVQASCLPDLLQHPCLYDSLPVEVANALNVDFRLHPIVLKAIPELFTGAIVHNQKTLLMVTREVYSRNTQLDKHAESSGRSLPPPGTSVVCSILEDSDEHGLKRKLVIGTSTINVLCTSSAVLRNELQIAIAALYWTRNGFDPAMITTETSRIYCRQSQIDIFLKAVITDTCVCSPNLSRLQQLTTAFDHGSMYAMLRATMTGFDNDLYLPPTFSHIAILRAVMEQAWMHL